MTDLTPHLGWVRNQFPALARRVNGRPAVFLDGPAGSQVPRAVAEAVAGYLLHTNANHGGAFATSRESDAIGDAARRAVADLLGTDDPDCVVFGPNMTSLTFALSRALAKTWRPGDEIIVTNLDHDANVSPWVLAARDAGAVVRRADVRPKDCTLDVEHLQSLLTPRTKLVAVGAASNAAGTVNPVQRVCEMAHGVGAQVFIDAVHYAPHLSIDVGDWGCDYLCCSPYKFFGPHAGVLWGRRDLLGPLEVYKVRPAADTLPDRLMTGTADFEAMAGTLAAVEYLADLGRRVSGTTELPRRPALVAAFGAIRAYEQGLSRRTLGGLGSISGVRVYGITDAGRLGERVPTLMIRHDKTPPAELVDHLAGRGVFAWAGNYYALPLTEALGLEPQGAVRLGALHYNTAEELDYTLGVLAEV